jgi:hypothetical protein
MSKHGVAEVDVTDHVVPITGWCKDSPEFPMGGGINLATFDLHHGGGENISNGWPRIVRQQDRTASDCAKFLLCALQETEELNLSRPVHLWRPVVQLTTFVFSGEQPWERSDRGVRPSATRG